MKKTNFKLMGFSMVEMIVTLIIVSVLLVSLAPVMTKKSKTAHPNVVISNKNTVPVGAIVYWHGENYPEDWMPVSGQDITGEEFTELRKALGGDVEKLPNLNILKLDGYVTAIIKYKRLK